MRRYGLSVALLLLFLASWMGQAAFQVGAEGEGWAAFWASTLENWQSEFAQLLTFVVLSAFLVHHGSPQSKSESDRLEAKVDAILERLNGRG